MPEKVLTEESRQRVEDLARQEGYETLDDYVGALLEDLARRKGITPVDYLLKYLAAQGEGIAMVRAQLAALLDDQSYFWTEAWQAGEREADADIAAGRIEKFDTMDDLLAELMDDE